MDNFNQFWNSFEKTADDESGFTSIEKEANIKLHPSIQLHAEVMGWTKDENGKLLHPKEKIKDRPRVMFDPECTSMVIKRNQETGEDEKVPQCLLANEHGIVSPHEGIYGRLHSDADSSGYTGD